MPLSNEQDSYLKMDHTSSDMARPVYIRDESANSGALGEAPFVTPFVLAFVDIVLAGFLVTLESVDRK